MSLRNILPLLRLRYTPVLLVPQYLGLVLATRDIWPDEPSLRFRWLLAALACSPLLGSGATYLLNDVVDLEDDRTNPRRQESPLVKGLVSRREALAWAIGLRLVALLLAFYISKEFGLVFLAMTALSIAYSVRPFRLKARPFFDVLAQAGLIGLLYPLTGWLIARPMADFPWLFHLHFMLALAGPLLFVLLYDLPTDRARGARTSAVWLGARRTVRVGLLLLAASLFLLVAFAAQRYIITPHFLLYALPLLGLQGVFLPPIWKLRDDPVRLKRYVYRTAKWVGLSPYVLWILYLGGILPQ